MFRALRQMAMGPRQSFAPALGAIKSMLMAHGEGAVRLANGIFVRKLEGGALHFLHKLYAGCSDAEVHALQALSPFPLPADYLVFMRWAGGADLFDNSLTLYGLGDNSARSVELADQAPISFPDHLLLQRQMGRSDDLAKWLPVGGVAAATETYSIELAPDGRARLVGDEGCSNTFASFCECLLTLITILHGLSDEDGPRDASHEEMQREMRALLRSH